MSLLKLYVQFKVNDVFTNILLGQLSIAFIKCSKYSMCHPTTPKKGTKNQLLLTETVCLFRKTPASPAKKTLHAWRIPALPAPHPPRPTTPPPGLEPSRCRVPSAAHASPL